MKMKIIIQLVNKIGKFLSQFNYYVTIISLPSDVMLCRGPPNPYLLPRDCLKVGMARLIIIMSLYIEQFMSNSEQLMSQIKGLYNGDGVFE